LTFGLHTRIDDRVEKITTRLNVGNMYVNRNQIGAVVGTQPFGGESLSGTGPKAGGPHYLKRFVSGEDFETVSVVKGPEISVYQVQGSLDRLTRERVAISSSYLPGPTGESNKLSVFPIGRVLCLGPTFEVAIEQAAAAQQLGCQTLIVCPREGVDADIENALDGFLPRSTLADLDDLSAVICASDNDDLTEIRKALSEREGALVPLISEKNIGERCALERHVCIDTTAAGGNVSLLASMA